MWAIESNELEYIRGNEMGIQQESVSIEWGGRTLTLETGTLATQASGAVTVQYGETIVLATAVMSRDPRPGIDFFPLTVDFEERMYAAGKIPGSRFVRRETRPGEDAILNSRLIDRSIRPCSPRTPPTMCRSCSLL
jgi:polyribonucleotide nucleotidyltransferase